MRRDYRLAVCLIALLMAVCLFVLPGKAEAAVVESGTCGEKLTWTLDDEGTLSITGTGAMSTWNSTGSDAPWYGKDIKTILISGQVTSISDYAFYNCDSVEELSLGVSITSGGDGGTVDFDSLIGLITASKPITIGRKAFFDCDSLTGVSIPLRVKSIGEAAFADCSGLQSIWVDEGHETYVSDGSGVLYTQDMTQLVQAPGALSGTYTIPESVTAVGSYAFNGCAGLSKLIVGTNLTDIAAYAFDGCDSLADVDYAGKTAQWQEIEIAEGNECLTNAKLRCLLDLNGWVKENGKWYYYKSGVKCTGWVKDGSYWYFMNAEGVMQTGWIKSGSTWYYLKPSGNMATGWAQVGGFWYYFDSNGCMKTGWLQVGGVWYYFKPAGNMATGWCQVGKTWYYFKSSGAMQTGWLKLGNTWYYFHSSGAMATGSVKIGTKTYKFNASGACLNP